jgi:hypothetical protein
MQWLFGQNFSPITKLFSAAYALTSGLPKTIPLFIAWWEPSAYFSPQPLSGLGEEWRESDLELR